MSPKRRTQTRLAYQSTGTWLPTISSLAGFWINRVVRVEGNAGGVWVAERRDGTCVRLGSGRELANDNPLLLKALWAQWQTEQAQAPCGCEGT